MCLIIVVRDLLSAKHHPLFRARVVLGRLIPGLCTTHQGIHYRSAEYIIKHIGNSVPVCIAYSSRNLPQQWCTFFLTVRSTNTAVDKTVSTAPTWVVVVEPPLVHEVGHTVEKNVTNQLGSTRSLPFSS